MRDRRLAWLLAVTTVLFVLAVWLDLTPWLRGPAEWRWPLRPLTQPALRLVFPIVLLGLYIFICSRWLRAFEDATVSPRRAVERGLLIFLTVAAPLIQITLAAAVYRQPLFQFFSATVSPAVTGYYSVAVTTPDLPTQLPKYAAFMPTLPIHPQTHPPGLVLIHWLVWRFFENLPALSDAIAMPLRTLQCHNAALMTLDNPQIASATIGMLVPAIGGLAVWPLYAFGKRVVGHRTAATAAALFPILPIVAVWSSQWDQVYPLLLCFGLYLAHTGLERRSPRRLFVASVSLSIGTFLSVGNAILIVIVGLYGLAWSLQNKPRRWIEAAVAFALGCVSIWIAYAILYRISLPDLIAVGTRLASESTRCPICPSTTRSYALWAIWNPIDFATFFSVPLTVLFLVGVPAFIAAFRAFLGGHAQPRASWAPLAVAALAPFIVLDVAGIVRGEVGRMWMYFAPLFALIALAVPESTPVKAGRESLVLALLALQLLTLNTRWLVTPSFLDEPPTRQAVFDAAEPGVKAQASFGHQIALTGYDAATSGMVIDLTLYWQALTQPLHAYTVFVHALDTSGKLVGQQDNMPMRDQLPTSCWQPGEYVADPYTVPLSAGARGPFSIEVGLYRLDTGQRLTLDGESATSVMLRVP